MKRILITGHTGMLGRSIVKAFQQHAAQYVLFGVSKTTKLGINSMEEFQEDLTNNEAISKVLSTAKPNIIIHTAAFTNLDYCERHRQETYQLHVNLSRRLAEYPGAKVVYLSTDSVFSDEGNAPFSEQDPTYPLNYYAHSKLEGEWATLRANDDALIVRTNIYGFKVPSGNSLAEWALQAMYEGQQISGYSDVRFNPLYVGQAAQILLKLLNTRLKGIIHIGTAGSISKFEFLRELATTFGFPENLVSECASPLDNRLRRPKNTSLNIGFLNNALNENPSVSCGLKMFKSDTSKLYENN